MSQANKFMNLFQRINNKDQWQQMLDKVFFKTFFHESEWESFLEGQFSWIKFEHYNYNNQALLSLGRAKVKGKEKLISHPFCEYGGPLPLVEKIDGEKFKQDLFEEFKEQIKISFHPKLLNYFTNLKTDGASRESFFFENLDSQTSKEIWQKLDRNRRRSIKRSREQKIQIVECQSEKNLKELYQFYVKNLKQHKTIVYPFSFFKFFFASKQTKILLAKLGQKILGGNIFLIYNGIVHSFLCGFNEKHKELGIHSMLLWKMVENAQNEGYTAFDFGATRVDSPLRQFKQRWGAVPYPILELKNYSGESKIKNSPFRSVWGFLPAWAIKKLSPTMLKYKI